MQSADRWVYFVPHHACWVILHALLSSVNVCAAEKHGRHIGQSELPRPFLQSSVESDHGCTLRIYFDNAGDNVMLTLYNVMLKSQKPC